MEAIYKGIKVNQKFQEAEQYAKKLEGIARTTNWYESKVKYEKARNVIEERKKVQEELHFGEIELKRRRRVKLEELYRSENEKYEAELKERGLVIYKTKI